MLRRMRCALHVLMGRPLIYGCEFDKPVSTGHDRELAEATSELKRPSYDPILPGRIADRIVNAATGNGRAVR